MFFAIDIDNTITIPRWFHPDFHLTAEYYVQAGIVTRKDIYGLEHHPQLYVLPQVAITHAPMEGAVETLQHIVSQGSPLQYFTARNHLRQEVCTKIHANTYTWLETHHFPNPIEVKFCWSTSEKLLRTLETSEEQSVLIDDRFGELLKAYRHIEVNDPDKAEQIRDRVTLIAFGSITLQQLPLPAGLRVIPVKNWSQYRGIQDSLGMRS